VTGPYFAARRISSGTNADSIPKDDDACMSTAVDPTSTSFEAATVADAMTDGMISCPPEATLLHVAELMSRHRVHAVFVFDYGHEDDEDVELWGLVSDLDLVAGAWAGIDRRTAGGSAVTPLVTVRSDDVLKHAAQLMAERGTAHLAVIDPKTKRPIGVISTLDIARVVTESAAPR
jgi:CBS domain-containing protein